MRRLGIVVIGILLLAFTGCIPGLDDIDGPIDGADSGPSYVLVEYQISTVALRADTGDESRIISTSIGSLGTIAYDPDLQIITCDAAVGDLLVQMWIYLNTTEDIIDYIKVRRIKPIAGGVWMQYDFIESYSVASATIELVRTEGNDKVFRVDQNTLFVDGFCDSIKTVEWRQWRPDPPYNETQQVPFYRLKDPFSTIFHDCSDAGNYVEVTLEYD
ncbi:hypothetical protein ACFLS5_01605 [Candidatus Bipolaricaulota bacterium]